MDVFKEIFNKYNSGDVDSEDVRIWDLELFLRTLLHSNVSKQIVYPFFLF